MKKKGVSLMVAYTILVVIGISLGAATYSYLKLYLPSVRAECPADISVSIEKITCDTTKNELSVSILNRGLFNVPALFVRFGEEDRRVKEQLNDDEEILPFPLSPNDTVRTFVYKIAEEIEDGKYVLEIQPGIIVKRVIVPCDDAIVSAPVQCTAGNGGGGGGCKPTEDPEISCSDGNDNDCDNYTDCEDSDCSTAQECQICGNDKDDNGDGRADDCVECGCGNGEACNGDTGVCEQCTKTDQEFCTDNNYECGMHDYCGRQVNCDINEDCIDSWMCRRDYKCVRCEDTEIENGYSSGTCIIHYMADPQNSDYYDDICTVENIICEDIYGDVQEQFMCDAGYCISAGGFDCVGPLGEQDKGICCGNTIVEDGLERAYCLSWGD